MYQLELFKIDFSNKLAKQIKKWRNKIAKNQRNLTEALYLKIHIEAELENQHINMNNYKTRNLVNLNDYKRVKECFDLLEINQLHIEKYDTQDYLFNIELLKCYEELDWKPQLIQFD